MEITRENENFILKFNKNDFAFDFLINFLKRINLEKVLENSKMTEVEAMELSKEIKSEWWSENKNKFLDKIGRSDKN